jgi:hypothetical protein
VSRISEVWNSEAKKPDRASSAQSSVSPALGRISNRGFTPLSRHQAISGAISPSCPRPSPVILLKFGLGKCFAIIPTAAPPTERKAMPTGLPGRLSSTCIRETV